MEGEGLYVNSNVYIKSFTKTTCNTFEMFSNALQTQIRVIEVYVHRFTGGFSDVLQCLTAANHCKLSMCTETNGTGLSRRHPQTPCVCICRAL